MDNRIALITGAYTGIGLSLSKRLLRETNLSICMVCRNKIKAYHVIRELNYEFPDKNIYLVICDIANPLSVIRAAKEIRERYSNISHIFCNAGVMSNPIIDWKYLAKTMFTRNFVHMMSTAQGLLKQKDTANEQGLCEIFSTNIFGHFILLQELEGMLGKSSDGGMTQIIWTSSSNAKKSNFNIDDIQHKNSSEPYGSSKYAIDLISYQLNQQWNHKGIYSHTMCPGLVITNFAYRFLHAWVWYFIIPILLLCRMLVPNLTLRPDVGSYSLFWLATANPVMLDPKSKFYSSSTFLGTPYVQQKQMDIEADAAKNTWQKMEHMLQDYKSRSYITD